MVLSMQNKKFTVAIIGVGGRGGFAYGTLLNNLPEKFDIVSLCDIKEDKLAYFSKKFGVSQENLFTDEDDFFKQKRADLLLIATQDKDHIRHATKAFNVGYDILLEKPISDNKQELEHLLALQKKSGCKALVCHVLRYAPAFMKAAELLDSGAIGRLVSINAIEKVGYFHQAQAYVRGYWRKKENSTPMILAKCSHDLDLIQFYANSSCETLSSIGELTHFKKEEAPEGATERCLNCPHQNTCPYSAKTQYLDNWLKDKTDAYPYNVPCTPPITEEKMRAALETTLYGKCVYHCDNDVVDHQLTQMLFKNGVKANLTMMAFTRHCGRRMEFFGTKGQITLDEVRDFIRVGVFGEPEYEIKISELTNSTHLHGGGDYGLVETLYDMMTGSAPEKTALAHSVESHLMGIAAEESRKAGGKLLSVH